VTVQTRHLLRLQQPQRGSMQTRNRGRGKTGAGRGRRSRTTSLMMTSTTRRIANVFQISIRYLRSMPWADDAELASSASSGPGSVFVDLVSISIDAPNTYQRTFILYAIYSDMSNSLTYIHTSRPAREVSKSSCFANRHVSKDFLSDFSTSRQLGTVEALHARCRPSRRGC